MSMVGALSKTFNKAEGPKNLCNLCGEQECDIKYDPFAGYSGAFTCMAKGYGDVAFVKCSIVDEMVTKDPATYGNETDYQLLCPRGGRKGTLFTYTLFM